MELALIPDQLREQNLDVDEATLRVLAEREASLAAIEELNLKPEIALGKLRIVNDDTRAKLMAATDARVQTDVELQQIRSEQQRIRTQAATGVNPDPHWDESLKSAWTAFPAARDTLAGLDEQRLQAGRAQLTAELPARMHLLSALTDPDAIVREWDEVRITAHPVAIRSLGRLVDSRLKQLATSGRAGTSAAAENRLSAFRQSFGQWSAENPTALERIETLEGKAAERERKIRAGARWAAQFSGLTDRTALVTHGRAFDE